MFLQCTCPIIIFNYSWHNPTIIELTDDQPAWILVRIQFDSMGIDINDQCCTFWKIDHHVIHISQI